MKIAFITYNIFSQGGVQRVVTNLANELAKDNYVDIICTTTDNDINPELYGLDINNINIIFKKDNSNFHERVIRKITKNVNNNCGILNKPRYNKLLSELLYPKSLKNEFIKYINENNYDIVIGVEGYFSLLLGLISKKIQAKTIGWQHNSFDAYLELISVGRLEVAKGFDLLIDAFNIFSKNNEDWNLDIIGDGKERDRLQQKIDDYDLSNRIKLLGSKNNIEEYYIESSIYLSSSRWEGLPLVLIEAMECGLPIISFDYPAAKEIIKDDNGILVESFDIFKFANAMLDLSNNYKQLSILSQNNKKDSEQYNKNIILDKWNKILSD